MLSIEVFKPLLPLLPPPIVTLATALDTVNSSIYGLPDLDFNNFQLFTKYTLILFMIIGRIELLTILLLIRKFLFKN